MSGMTADELLDAALNGDLDQEGDVVDAAAAVGDGQGEQQNDQKQEQSSQQAEQEGGKAGEKEGDSAQQGASTDEEQDGAPVLSKSGNYTIPYQKLVDARTERDSLREQVAQLQQQIAGLTAKQQANLAQAQSDAQTRAESGATQTKADQNLAAAEQALANGMDASIFGDFSEQAIARGMAELNRRTIEQVRTEMQTLVQQAVAPLQQREAQSAQAAHEAAILQAHPDAYEIAESAEFAAWLDGLPTFAKAGVENAITNGSAQQVVDVLDAFRATTKPAPQQQDATQKAAPEAPKARVPVSLSEVPGAAPVDETQQTLAMAGNAEALLDRMAGMTPEQIDALMNRI